MSRAYTKEEVRQVFLEQIVAYADYWAKQETESIKEKCRGVAFSILNIFDGTASDFPAMDIVLAPHEEDKAFYQSEEENWFESGMVINDDVHLHDIFVGMGG